MFKNILIGVDGSEHGRDAVALATRLAAADASLTLGHVHSGALRPSTAITPGLAREEHADADALLAAERAATGAEAALANIVAPTPGRGLHEQAERQNADLIVVGSCSRGLIGRTLIGNDTRAALNGAPCAVAVAARGYAEHPVPFARSASATTVRLKAKPRSPPHARLPEPRTPPFMRSTSSRSGLHLQRVHTSRSFDNRRAAR